MKTTIIAVLVAFMAGVFTVFVATEVKAPTETQREEAVTPLPESAETVETQTTETREPPSTPVSVGGIEIYDGISFPKNSTAVDLSGRGLTGSLKGEVRMLSSVRQLDLSDNDFTGLPAEVGQLSKLEILDLSNNPFTGLPHELGNLSNLKVLDLRGTNYSEFDLTEIRKTLPASTEVLTSS